MEYNPEALEDKKQVIATDSAGNPITKQHLVGGGTVVERDVEAGEGVGTSTTTTGPAATVTVTTNQPTTARQTVRPSPTAANSGSKQTFQRSTNTSGRWWDALTTKGRGRYFFPLHAAIVLFSFMVLVSAALIENLVVPNFAGNPTATAGGSNTASAVSAGNGFYALSTQFIQYAIVVAQFSFAASLGACVMERVGLLENPLIRIAISAFQLFFWVPALVLLTFFGAFLSPITSANGFFGAWLALLAAAAVFSHETQQARPERRNRSAPLTALLLLFFIGLMEMGSAIQLWAGNFAGLPNNSFTLQNGPPGNYTIFGIVWGAVTAGCAAFLMLMLEILPSKAMLFLGFIFWCWVVVGALVLTFGDPWKLALGNGYYSCLFAIIASMGLLLTFRNLDDDEDNRATTTNRSGRNVRNGRDDNYYSGSFFMFVRGGTLASLGLLVAACLVCRNDGGCPGRIAQFQVAAGAVGLGLGLIFVIIELVGFGTIASIIKIVFGFIWFGWWVGSFIVITWYGTFQSPILNTQYANGFFFTWVALVFATLAFAAALKEQGALSDPPSPIVAKLGFLILIIGGSAIELGAGIKWYYDIGNNNLTRYAIALACVSIGLVVLLMLILPCVRNNDNAHDSVYNGILYLLAAWWAVGALVLTFKPLWTGAIDNGYFSLYFTLGTVLLALSGVWRFDDDDDYYEAAPTTTTETTTTVVQQQQGTTGAPVTNTTYVPPATTSGPTTTARY